MNDQTSPENQLKSASALLVLVGALSCIIGIVFLLFFVNMDELIAQEVANGNLKSPEEKLVFKVIVYTVHSIGIGIGLLFILLGALVPRFPRFCTLTALLIYLGDTLLTVAAGMFDGMIFKILIIFLLIQGVRSAFAYKRERRALAEASMHGDFDNYALANDPSRNTF